MTQFASTPAPGHKESPYFLTFAQVCEKMFESCHVRDPAIASTIPTAAHQTLGGMTSPNGVKGAMLWRKYFYRRIPFLWWRLVRRSEKPLAHAGLVPQP